MCDSVTPERRAHKQHACWPPGRGLGLRPDSHPCIIHHEYRVEILACYGNGLCRIGCYACKSLANVHVRIRTALSCLHGELRCTSHGIDYSFTSGALNCTSFSMTLI